MLSCNPPVLQGADIAAEGSVSNYAGVVRFRASRRTFCEWFLADASIWLDMRTLTLLN
jgi:hypothetical protein